MTPDERAKDVCYRAGWTIQPWVYDIIVDAIRDAIAAEREACAQIAERYAAEWLSARHIGMDIPTTLNSQLTAEDLARRIRARA